MIQISYLVRQQGNHSILVFVNYLKSESAVDQLYLKGESGDENYLKSESAVDELS